MAKALRQVEQVAGTDATVLLVVPFFCLVCCHSNKRNKNCLFFRCSPVIAHPIPFQTAYINLILDTYRNDKVQRRDAIPKFILCV